ncbi:MAG TPA: bifunctional shikimate kinase/3-dehydroquinate synthase [Acidimicrobiales bacterium]
MAELRMTAHVVLVGLPGTGKTTVGRRLAKELARPFADLDEQIELTTGRTVAQLFAERGEDGFRRTETAVLRRLLGAVPPLVLAAGGGVVTRPENRELLGDPGVTVVWLRAPAAFLAERTDPSHRPLLAGDAAAALERLLTERTPLYEAVADRAVDVEPFHGDQKPKRALARHIAGLVRGAGAVATTGPSPGAGGPAAGEPATIHVATAAGAYPVVVGSGARETLAELLPPGARRAAVVTQPGIGVEVPVGIEHAVFPMGEGEEAKTLATVEDLCRSWARWGLTRADVVVAVGGGVVTDTAGFAAASYHRGVAVAHVPTTLLGMVDAAIGGKTGVNLPEGKNVVGAFWQPHAVVCDTDTLASLPERERRSGLGEMAKYHFLTGEDLLALPLDARVAACVRVKADVVAADEREELGGRRGRAILNYGHTLAHALETAGSYDLRHGEAVAVGLAYAAELAHVLGRIDRDRVEEHRHVLESYGLRWTLPEGAATAELVELMARDKKAVEGLTFVLDGPTGVEVVPGVDPRDAGRALDRLRGAR